MSGVPELGVAIRRLRRQRGWSLAQLAEMVGISVGFLSEIERGRKDTSLAHLRDIATAFGLRHSELWAEAGL
jgi:transcriptional regulator with XRE-family HTH domain